MRCNWLRKFTASALLAAGLSSVTGCYSVNGYVMNRSGQAYYEQGNYQAAATEFQQAVMSDPYNPDYLANLARTRYRMGDPAGAEQMYRQALTMSPAHQPSYHGLAELMVATGRGNEANGLLQTWASTQPYDPEAHVEMAWLQTEMGQSDAAMQSLQQALQINPQHSTALAQLGQYYQDSGQPQYAVAMYQKSLQADWNQPDVQSRMAAAAQAAGANHPMSETAMARGMYPYQMAQQQYAFGPPSPGAQMAQMQIQQQQLAMSPYPIHSAMAATNSGAMAQWQNQTQVTQMPPSMPAMSPSPMMAANNGAAFDPFGPAGWQTTTAPSSMQMMHGPMASGAMAPQMAVAPGSFSSSGGFSGTMMDGDFDFSTLPGSPVISQPATPGGASPIPQPDPAFQS
ncbi:MAG: tetratricopeptide repeat protein, partial [Planctomycetaceae bacterium]|nr:tetratricopeptide repeat protein [Planctomycetaceae bacterium]